MATMISLDKVLSKICNLTNAASSNTNHSRERFEFLSFQLQQIVDKAPTGDFKSLEPTIISPPWLQQGLKGLFHLRVNHTKTLIHMRTFSSWHGVISHPRSAKALISLAKSSVDVHQEMCTAGNITPFLLPTVIKLLLSSISTMVLLVSYSPEDYGTLCSEPFYTAIHILSKSNPCVQAPGLYAWGTLGDLEKIAQKAHMPPRPSSPLNEKSGPDENSSDLPETSLENEMFVGLGAPDPQLFSMFENVSVPTTDMLYMNDLLGSQLS